MTIDDKKDIQDALNILSEMIDKEIIDDTPIPTNFIHRPSYSKAIDDFIHECDKYCGFYSGDNKNLTREAMLSIAEQLKAGGNNEK